ncbi:fatty acid hydroxylase domain-containing protein 2-like [Amphiura filiformis]|uniref:fatty acid hydroxylase domain-containing protein 2-like n=1 Tax=Amphiura filiformis TaxID=82378 RepID=UPI003B214EDB
MDTNFSSNISGTILNHQWNKLHDWYEGDGEHIRFIGRFLAPLTAYWLVGGFFMIVDTFKPNFLTKYKVQPDEEVTMPRLLGALRVVLINHIISVPVVLLFHWIEIWRGCDMGRDLPSIPRFLIDALGIVLCEEIAFYYSHRLLHHPRLYKHIHKKHHEWTAPCSITAIYCHPVEQIFSNLIPVYLGPLVTGCHTSVQMVWFFIGLVETCFSHSGYHLPFCPPPEFHDFHHMKFVNNFGAIGLLDRLHNTDNLFKNSVYSKRRRLLLRFTPILELYPEDREKKTK